MAETVDLAVGNVVLSATVGFEETGRAAELFLSGAKDGSGMAAIPEDPSVAILIAVQHGIPASALAKSVARIPETVDGSAVKAASPIGAALDLIAELENA
jgi:ribonucleoside-diphosphate reductase alpha chain